jgi:hyperosmotically inducible periplasmic protein
MRTLTLHSTLAALALMGILIGCSQTAKSPDVSGDIRKSLDQASLKDVSVSQDRDKGVITLGGHVVADTQKAEAETIAKTAAAGQVVADEIVVLPQGMESQAKTVNTDLDKGIKSNLDAALVQNQMQKNVTYDVNAGVVTLKGEVPSEAARTNTASVAMGVPNVKQVVNELQVKNQKASSSL